MAGDYGACDLDYEFVESPPSGLVCIICHLVSKDPQQLQCCGRVCCNGCLQLHKKSSGLCPQCSKPTNSFPDKRSERDVKSLKVKCSYFSKGCLWIGELQYMSKHLATCDLCNIPCPNKCTHELTVMRKDLEHHLHSECPRRSFSCPHCEESGEFHERTTSHLEQCPQIVVSCPNHPRCSGRMKRKGLGKHRMVCTYEEVACKYAKLGCGERLNRKDMSVHEKNSEQHLKLALDTVVKHEERMDGECEWKVPNQFTFKLDNFHNSTVYNSPPFYAFHHGYKMCINVKTKYFDSETNKNYVSVYFHLMKGEYDDYLEWPFRGNVGIELLNQLEDKHHCGKYTLWLPDADANVSGERVVDREKDEGYGFPTFISHDKLGYSSTFQREYLKDDCLYFRVTVSNNKPWLTCTPCSRN